MKELTVSWNSEAGPMRFEATGPDGVNVVMDAAPEHGGQSQGFSPKYMLLVALGGCTGMDVLSILRKMRQDVKAYRVEIKGWEHEEHPKKFDRILIEHVVEGRNLNREMVEKAVQLSSDKYCGVSASLKGPVEIETKTTLVEV